MLFTQYPINDVKYASLNIAEEELRREGWKLFHAGNWRHPGKRGAARDVRKTPEGFVIWEWIPIDR